MVGNYLIFGFFMDGHSTPNAGVVTLASSGFFSLQKFNENGRRILPRKRGE
jgi:hypothetical protein